MISLQPPLSFSSSCASMPGYYRVPPARYKHKPPSSFSPPSRSLRCELTHATEAVTLVVYCLVGRLSLQCSSTSSRAYVTPLPAGWQHDGRFTAECVCCGRVGGGLMLQPARYIIPTHISAGACTYCMQTYSKHTHTHTFPSTACIVCGLKTQRVHSWST